VTSTFRSLVIVLGLVALTAPVLAQSKTVAGRWKMAIQFTDETRPAGLEIVLKGREVSGKFVAAFAGGDVPIEGEIDGDALTFSASTTGGPHPGMQLDFSATLKGDGTLAGKLSAPFGDFSWTAQRLD
jgi:hypothetical protein